ncbi:MAG: glycosyltransferase [Bacillus sp. (in: Bacteria)]|nr:glycosyltransferase [Bacillus sp. (in: firmicutes)]MCM1426687.1 glycosyltransferase [Eubacterium sp.]
MKILFIQSASLQNISALMALDRMGHETFCYPENDDEIQQDEEHEEKFGNFLRDNRVDFVLSHFYIGAVARQTKKYGVKFAVYSMDSPSFETWWKEAFSYTHCYYFYFDKKEYQMAENMGCSNAYYLPLPADIQRGGNIAITDKEIRNLGCDISFVGSLYSENLYDEYVQVFSEKFQDSMSEIMEKCAFLWDGQDRMGSLLTQEMMNEVKERFPGVFEELTGYKLPEAQYMKAWFFSRKLTNIERTLMVELLAETYPQFRLYTRAKEIVPPGVKRFPETDVDGAYKVFYASKINLNMTLRSIESGIPRRVFDIMSVGGFVLSNWQEEMTELFEEDKEIVLFKTPEEMIEKIDYYLAHEEERVKISINGYQKVKNCYSYEQQLNKLISVLY